MRRKISVLLAIAACFALFAACKKDKDNSSTPPESSSVSVEKETLALNKTSVTLKIGDKTTVTPVGVDGQSVEYFSGAENVATVDGNGEVTAVSVGTANIYVTVGELTAVCTVTVQEKLMPAYSVSLSREEYTLERGENYTLVPVVRSGDELVENAVCTFVSSDEAVATVDETGKLTAIRQGETLVTVGYGKEENYTYKQVVVTVIRPLEFVVSQSVLDLTPDSASQALSARVFDGETEIEDAVFTWSCDDESVARVDPATGVVVPLAAGETTVYASFEKGKVACKVNVWTAMIANENDFAAIYNDPDGRYKLADNVTLNTGAGVMSDGAHYGYAFNGVLDGGGYTLTNATGQRLFQTLNGTVKNMSIAGSVEIWSPVLAYGLTGVIENVDFDVTFKSLFVCRNVPSGYIPDLASGVVTENDGLIKNCHVSATVKENLSLKDIHGSTKSANGYTYAVASVSAYAMHMQNGRIENCTAQSNKEISFIYGSPNAGIVKADKECDAIVLDVDATQSVCVEGATYESSDTNVVKVDENGTITAIAGGSATVRVITDTVTFKYPVHVWQSVATDADFMKIYDAPDGYYKLANDVTLKTNASVFNTGAYYGYTFKGTLDGNGHKLTVTTNARLFQSLSGTIKNMTLESTVSIWGAAVAYELKTTGVIENVDFIVTFETLSTCRSAPTGYIPDLAAGVVTENDGLIKDCHVSATVKENLSLTDIHGGTKSAHGYTYAVSNVSAYSMLMTNGRIENCTAEANQAISFVYGTPEAGTVKSPVYADPMELTVGDTKSVAQANATYESSDTSVATVSADGTITAKKGGVAIITVKTAEVTTIYTVGVWQAIATATDWLKVYEEPAGYYKLTANIDLSGNWTDWMDYACSQSKLVTFTGVIDGNGKTISGITTRLFAGFNGTIKNVTLVGGDSSVTWSGWFGGLLSIDMTGATVENVTASVTLYHVCASNNSSQNYVRNAGGLSASINASTLKNSTINVTIADTISTDYVNAASYPVSAISAWGAGAGNTFVNCTATSNNATIQQLGTLNS